MHDAMSSAATNPFVLSGRGIHYVQAGFISSAAWWMTIPPGSIVTAILLVNKWFSMPFAIRATRVVLTQKGRPLNAALAGTGQTALAFSLLFW